MDDPITVRTRWDIAAKATTLALLGTACLPGCAALGGAARQPPALVPPQATSKLLGAPAATSSAETWYAEAVRLHAAGSAEAVDAYLQAAAAAWPEVEMIAGGMAGDCAFADAAPSATVHDSREWDLYQSAIVGLLTSAQEFGRWQPAVGLLAAGPQGLSRVQTAYEGFLWAPGEFGAIHPIGAVRPTLPARSYRRDGLGVPVIVERTDAGGQRPFVKAEQSFAATALVRPVLTTAGPAVRLEFYDPLRESRVRLAAGDAPLAADISTPLAPTDANLRQQWLEPFLRPAGGGANDNLKMIEPYQAGKIPVLLVHGLLSDPLTWTDMINELRAEAQVSSRYQIWTFRYDTGAPFLTSAAALRRELAQLDAYYNPGNCDPAADNIVIVGHSMGGLVANLQVTSSGDALWNAGANVPLAQIRTDPVTRDLLAEAFYFEPSANISRVVYIGTPHLGSGYARRAVGSLGAALVTPAPQTEERHAQLLRDNPEVLGEEWARRFPTSIDLLNPDSPLLQATARLPYRPGVVAHSIIGEGRYTVGYGESDGVVPVASARLVGAASETFVDVRHARQPRDEAVIREVMRILVEHAQAVDVTIAGTYQ